MLNFVNHLLEHTWQLDQRKDSTVKSSNRPCTVPMLLDVDSVAGEASCPSCRAWDGRSAESASAFFFDFVARLLEFLILLIILFDITFLLATFVEFLAAQEGILNKEDAVSENINLFEAKFHAFRRPKQPKQHIQRTPNKMHFHNLI